MKRPRKLDLVDHQGGATGRTGQRRLGARLQEPVAPRRGRARPRLIAVAAGPHHRRDVGLAPRWLIEAVVVDIPLVAGPDVLQPAEQKLARREGEALRLSIPVVLVAEGHLLAVVSDDPAFGERRPAGVATAISRRLAPIGVAARDVDHKAAGILPKQAADQALDPAVPFPLPAQPGEQIVLPEPSILGDGKQLYRLPDLIGPQPAQ